MSRVPNSTGPSLFVLHSAQPGGGEIALLRYLKETPSSDHIALFLQNGPMIERYRSAGIDCVIAESSSILSAIMAIYRNLKRYRPLVVVSNTMRAACLVALVPSRAQGHVYYVRDIIDRTHLSMVKLFLVRLVLRTRVDAVIANSRATAQSIGVGKLGDKTIIATSCSGITDDRIKRTRSHRPPEVELVAPIRILSLSRLAPWKGQLQLLEALEDLANTGVDRSQLSVTIAGGALYGEEAYEATVRALADKSPYPVTVIGFQANVQELLDSHDILVHTSLVPEPFGQVIVQGIGNGLAVIASEGGGADEIIAHGAGLTWSPKVPGGLTEAIRAVVTNAELRDEMIVRGYDRASLYTDEVCVRTLRSALETHRLSVSKEINEIKL